MEPVRIKIHLATKVYLFSYRTEKLKTFLCCLCVISRFLKTMEFKIEKTVTAWEEMLKWRKEFGTDRIIQVRDMVSAVALSH